ncbi:carbohydrate esterase family 3 protein, partial [Periconia macrospinosa]
MASNLGARSVGAVLLALLSIVLASPLFDAIPTTKNGQLSDLKPRAGDFYLRIMPLGASITYGDPHPPDTGGRGYRKYLRDQIRFRGWLVNMVGSRKFGEDFTDNDVEGWPGATIDGVYDKANSAVPKYKPNVILLNAGTNDATGNMVSGAGDRLEKLVRLCLEKSPGVTILLSTLLPNGRAPENVVNINKQYRALAAKLRLEGKKVQIAEMHDGFITPEDIFDGTHPTGKGFSKMGSVWWAALELADAKNWLSPPSQDVNFHDGDTTSSDNTCDKEFGSGNSDPRSGEQILYAVDPLIANDGTYRHSSQPMGRNPGLNFAGPGRETKVSFATLLNRERVDRGAERDDMVYVIRTDAGTALYMLLRNYGDGVFEDTIPFGPNMDCDWDGGEWVDMNNDGFDDFVCISPQGDLDVAINTGSGNAFFRNVGRVKNSETSDRAHVRLADIDGDGRFDYCVTDDGGNIRCWRNGGIGDTPAYWQDLGVVFTGKGMGDIGGTRFVVDINGDGRSDWLWVDNTGKVTTYINQRGYDKSLVPLWLEAGVTHQGMGSTVGREKIHFGRLYGSGRRDYAHRVAADLGSDVWQYGMEVYKNTGVGGKHQKGDGARWGPMSGKGNDDYIWISPDGKIVPFVNKNTPPDTTQYKNGWAGKGVVLATGMDRKALHIGDWDGDGKADIIGVDKKTGALTVWFTSYTGPGGTFSFRKETLGGTWCTQGWGVGLFDIGARFADVSGNGCVDYLCMEPDGRTTGWINNCPNNGNNFNLENVGQIKKSEGLDRANHKWVDVNGDGKADFLWSDKFNGDAKYWSNTGRVPESDRPNQSGSIFHFDPKGTSYLGSSRGTNMHYPNLGGLGRADQVSIQPATGYGWVWYNTCPAGGGGDDGGIAPRDPVLPRYDPS